METEVPSSQTIAAASPPPDHLSPAPDLSSIPPIAILVAHFKDGEEQDVEETLRRCGASVTSDISKVKVFIGKVGTKRRAEFELRSRKLKVEVASEVNWEGSPGEPPAKKRKTEGSISKPIPVDDDDGSTTEDEVAEDSEIEHEDPLPTRAALSTSNGKRTEAHSPIFRNHTSEDIVWVIKLNWLHNCVAKGHLLPLGDHLVYMGKVLERPAPSPPKSKSAKIVCSSPLQPASRTFLESSPLTSQRILERAKTDVSDTAIKSKYQAHRSDGHGPRRFEGRGFVPSAQKPSLPVSQKSHAHLLQTTTSEYEGIDSEIPAAPLWVEKGIKYACQRFTPANGPNEDFLTELKKMRTARTLIDDSVGVRAYSTIIAAIAAYPYKLSHPCELLRLPGCEDKTVILFVEWKNTGAIQAVADYENDTAMEVLRLFYNIWGVGAKTARHFYYNKGWTELDDIIEYGWDTLDRVQQIGVKYYDEFLSPIPRSEVEQIASVVREHAIRVRDERITVTIVGGYRRGKAASGDVDLIVSHPDLDATADLIKDIVEALEVGEWITHTLLMSFNGTQRDQNTLPFRTTKSSGAGFDTLDKALVVWQDPVWPSRATDVANDPNARNPNMHRRVDIIVSPWRTVGCAVMGWSSGTTFQRDLRRYAKNVKGWKFDSSGIRSRNTGEVVRVEGPNGVDGSPEDAERKVFDGMGLEYIPPEQRCTC
ncbi:Nucleotidyltransferase [Pleomassaria siparia CBS 279.74]|uniref:DNA-directed DNA polymerase n=1 Tax=Pleomassaria siparia CBS 279.74 TaxID=1314801 RepID=A0A6G1KQZ0_9PLEO|nr:Nucleotidyltransferase [Pleomassaria siparia CBS 279.74]